MTELDPIRKFSRKRGISVVDRPFNSNPILIPTYIFRNRQLSVLEVIVKHLKEERKLSYREISVILGRDERNVWTVYNRVRQKNLALSHFKPETVEISDVFVPASIFVDRTLAVLEALVEYLRDVSGLNYHEIGMILGRDERTVWTAYARAKEKRRRNETR